MMREGERDSRPGTEGDRPGLPGPCAGVRDHLYARAEGEALSRSALGSLEAHLEDCPGCRAELEKARRFGTKVSSLLGDLKPSDSMQRKVLEAVVPRAGSRGLAVGVAALAAVIAAGLALLVLARREPAARIALSQGEVTALRSSRGEWRPAPGSGELRIGERLELGDGARAALRLREGELSLMGPTLVQLGRASDGAPVVHLLREARLAADVVEAREVELRAGDVRIRAEGARLLLTVEATGEAELRLESGRATSRDASGERPVTPGEVLRLRQRRRTRVQEPGVSD